MRGRKIKTAIKNQKITQNYICPFHYKGYVPAEILNHLRNLTVPRNTVVIPLIYLNLFIHIYMEIDIIFFKTKKG